MDVQLPKCVALLGNAKLYRRDTKVLVSWLASIFTIQQGFLDSYKREPSIIVS